MQADVHTHVHSRQGKHYTDSVHNAPTSDVQASAWRHLELKIGVGQTGKRATTDTPDIDGVGYRFLPAMQRGAYCLGDCHCVVNSPKTAKNDFSAFYSMIDRLTLQQLS